MKFDELNSVGVVLIILNIISFVLVMSLLPEPQPYKLLDDGQQQQETKQIVDEKYNDVEDVKKEEDVVVEKDDGLDPSFLNIIAAILTDKQVAVPFFTLYVFNANFQIVEAALAPAAADALNWGPFETSTVMGSSSFFIFGSVVVVNRLSKRGARDIYLLLFGLLFSAIGYSIVWFSWRRGVKIWQFVVPILATTASFPFLGSTNRSLFSAAVDASPYLSRYSGMMQALISMSSSVAGFTAPSIVTAFFLRDPSYIDMTTDGRELSAWTLLSPGLTMFAFFLVIWAGEPLSLRPESFAQIEMEESIRDNDATKNEQYRDLKTEKTSLLSSIDENHMSFVKYKPSRSGRCTIIRVERSSKLSPSMVCSFRAESAQCCMGVLAPDDVEYEEESL
uniref:Major facilitator superfamily (MFS) profile domain-containing protein n=1 Tax=Ditylum brightwellii TaxID=49249 RepID=A0A7S4R9W4_9STRA